MSNKQCHGMIKSVITNLYEPVKKTTKIKKKNITEREWRPRAILNFIITN